MALEIGPIGAILSETEQGRYFFFPTPIDVISPLHFYEKVIKVKADVAALHIFFLRHRRCCIRWRGELSRAPFAGVHLDP